MPLGNLRTTAKFPTTTSVDWANQRCLVKVKLNEISVDIRCSEDHPSISIKLFDITYNFIALY